MATNYTMSSYTKYIEPRNKNMDLLFQGSFTPASLALNDTFKFFYIHPNMAVQSIGFIFPALDGGATLTIDVGDSSSATLFLSADTTGQAGGAKTTVTGLPKIYTSADYLTMKAHAAAGTPALAAISFFVSLVKIPDANFQ